MRISGSPGFPASVARRCSRTGKRPYPGTSPIRHPVLVFDFDGTLVDSNRLKRTGFDVAFQDHPECVTAVPDILHQCRGLSRREIIRELVDRIPGLAEADREAEAGRRVAAYSSWVADRIVEKAAESPAGVLLPKWWAQADLFVCSLTPTDPLNDILTRSNWLRYFRGAQGYPVSKEAMLRDTAAKYQLPHHRVLMIGDDESDEIAARQAGASFFRIRTVTELVDLDRYLAT